jgi:hypothetical protein
MNRYAWASIVVLCACNGTGPDYPPFDGPAPTVSNVDLGDGAARAIIRDPQGAETVGRTDYTYVFLTRAPGSVESHLSFASEWTWTRVDELTWRVSVPIPPGPWAATGWHVADLESNVKIYQCPDKGACVASEEPVLPR